MVLSGREKHLSNHTSTLAGAQSRPASLQEGVHPAWERAFEQERDPLRKIHVEWLPMQACELQHLRLHCIISDVVAGHTLKIITAFRNR